MWRLVSDQERLGSIAGVNFGDKCIAGINIGDKLIAGVNIGEVSLTLENSISSVSLTLVLRETDSRKN